MKRSTLALALLWAAGCNSKHHCGDGGVMVPEEDGGFVCIADNDPDGSGGTGGTGGSGGHIGHDGGSDGPAPFCGDFICNGDETCSTCPSDCGTCSGFCGDGICNNGETCSTCSTDCGSCAFCGDGVCNGTETCSTCSTDCGACVDAAPTCPSPQQIFTSVTGSTTGATSCSTASCGTGTATAPDATYYFIPQTSGTCHAQTTGGSTNFDTVLSVRTSPTGTDIICNDDNGMSMTPTTASYLTWDATAFTTYYIVVDGYNGTSGTFTLTVACP